ncbi:MAG: hypothetical protein AAGA85_07680 [Bacteroidota bacterium]
MAGRGFLGNLSSWKVVLLSLLGATTFWFFNELNKEHTTRLIYPLEFKFDRDSVVIMQPLPESLKIDVTSGGWNLLRRTFILFNPQPITIELDNPTLIRFYPRASLLPIVTDQLNELRINYLLTDTIYLNIEEKRSRRFQLQIDSARIDLRENYRITTPLSVRPDSVELIGPKSIIDTLSNPYQFILPDNRIDDDYEDDVELPMPRRDLMVALPEEIEVIFSVGRFEEVTIPVRFDALNFPADSSVVPVQETIDVRFVVKRSDRNRYEERDFGITLDYNLLDPTDSTVVAIMIYAPEEAVDVQMDPEYMKILYR